MLGLRLRVKSVKELGFLSVTLPINYPLLLRSALRASLTNAEHRHLVPDGLAPALLTVTRACTSTARTRTGVDAGSSQLTCMHTSLFSLQLYLYMIELEL